MSYLALQGSNDGDVESFMGAQQYERIHLRQPGESFKAAVYIHRANHGQWNRNWGRSDKSPFPRRAYFNSKPVMPVADQERIGKAYITAFLDATLLGKKEYVPLFQDHRAGAAWLPDTIFISRYSSSRTRIIADYDEDIDPTTTTLPGGDIDARQLDGWREQPIGPPGNLEVLETRGAYLGWDVDAIPGEPSYTVALAARHHRRSQAPRWSSRSPTEMTTPTRAASGVAIEARPPTRCGARGRVKPIDFTIEVIDAAGATARLPLLHLSLLQAQAPVARVEDGVPPAAPCRRRSSSRLGSRSRTSRRRTRPSIRPGSRRSDSCSIARRPGW